MLIALLAALAVLVAGPAAIALEQVAPAGTRSAAEEAFIYGLPMVMNYGVMYEYAIDTNSAEYKAPFNQIASAARVFTPQDTAVVTPNSDTPYSILWMDLRAEPVVLCVPEVEKSRYYSVQLIDLYTFNYGYIGSRATGNGAGCYMVAGPDWKGQAPKDIQRTFRAETWFSAAIYRTQLFGPTDIDNVKKVQAGYSVQTLSQYLRQPAPAPAPQITFPKIDKALAKEDPFAYLNFVLQFCPPVPAESALRARLASIGVEPGKTFDRDGLSSQQQAALAEGMHSGMEKVEKAAQTVGEDVNGWRMGVNGGDRAFYHGDWLRRAAVAMAGIYANNPAEALYPTTHTDSAGARLDGATNHYTITFAAGQLPPVNAFWSVTMYDAGTQLLVANPINRYLINQSMLADLKKNRDGSLTLYVQNESPGPDRESNWLPAPNAGFYLVMRLYRPKLSVLIGYWKPPKVQRAG
jgi:hypothetical protein